MPWLMLIDYLWMQFINVYSPQFETAGKFWPTVHNSMIFSLLLMHAIALGIFTLKKLEMASYIIFPLPVFTLLFNEYCRKRFLPTFFAYSAEVPHQFLSYSWTGLNTAELIGDELKLVNRLTQECNNSPVRLPKPQKRQLWKMKMCWRCSKF